MLSRTEKIKENISEKMDPGGLFVSNAKEAEKSFGEPTTRGFKMCRCVCVFRCDLH